MKQYRIALIIGSLRKDSLNKQLAQALIKLAPPEFVFETMRIDDLPFYNQDEDDHQAASVQRFKKDLKAADGLLFCTPEYNRSVPGVLKNALDNASRPYGDSAWAKKPAGIIGISVGSAGTSMAQQHLRNILAYLDVPVLCQPEAFIQSKEGLFGKNGAIGEGSRKFLQGWMDNYVAWVKKFKED